MMELKDKELWLELYEVAEKIQELEPWKYLREMDLLVYLSEPLNEVLYCSVMGHEGMYKSIAIYQEEQIHGFLELEKGQYPNQQLINYQECITCNFLSRQETLPKNREIIKELGLSFRGIWISFENFEKGYEPSPININQVKIMIEALKNFYMMFRLIIKEGAKIDFENGKTLERRYDKKKKLFFNYLVPLILPEKHFNTIETGLEFEENIMKLPQTEMELEYEFLNYVPIRIKNNKEQDGRYYYPIARFLAERKSGFAISHKLIDKNDYKSKNDYILESAGFLVDYFYKVGRPRSIYVRDEETKMYLKDILDKAKIKIVVSPKLKVIDEFYRYLERMGI